MSLDALVKLLPPPTKPVGGVGDWSTVEDELGVVLPTDYKEFVSVYGVGSIGESIWILNPFTKDFNLTRQMEDRRRGHQYLIDNLGHDVVPYSLFPEPGGILPWATTSSGDVCYWVTGSSSSDDWIVFVESSESDWEQFDCSMTVFLEQTLSGKVESFVLPPGFLSSPPVFRPYSSATLSATGNPIERD